MVSSCCVVGCANRRVTSRTTMHKRIRFYRFPKSNKERKIKWMKAVGRDDWEPSHFSRVCSDHFVYGEKSDNKLSPNYVPCLFQHTTPAERRRLHKLYDAFSTQLFERLEKISTATTMLSLVEEESSSTGGPEKEGSETKRSIKDRDSSLKDKNCVFEYAPDIQEMLKNYPKCLDLLEPPTQIEQSSQTVLAGSYLNSLEDEYSKLKSELSEVKEKDIFRDMELDMFKDNDEMVKNLTGLESYNMLKVLSTFINRYQGVQGKLSKFQQLMIALMKLKLNLPMPFLAILFSVSLATISRLFRLTVDILFKQLVPILVFWPSVDDMRGLIPPYFADCSNCLYLVDCFEVEVELSDGYSLSSKNMKDADDSDICFLSSVRDVMKRKYFMVIAPQGSVIFISKGVGGEVSDRSIALESGFFENVSPGDIVVTERKIDFDDEVEYRGATPAFLKAKKCEAADLVSCRKVMNSLKERYQILAVKMLRKWASDSDKDNFSTSDKIVHVACALFNMTHKEWNYEACLSH